MDAKSGLFAGSLNSNELVVIQGHSEVNHTEINYDTLIRDNFLKESIDIFNIVVFLFFD
jgi:hypothetical protein